MRIVRRFVTAAAASPAPENEDRRRRQRGMPAELHAFCLDWGRWVATRRLLGPPPVRCVLGQLRPVRGRTMADGPRVRFSQDIAGFHLALHQVDERAAAALWARYVMPAQGVRVPIGRLAEAMHVNRQYLYDLAAQAAQRAYAQRIVAARRAAGLEFHDNTG